MTSCTLEGERDLRKGTKEFVTVTLTSNVTLDSQTVEFSIDDEATWLDAEAVGVAGNVRKYRHLFLPEEIENVNGVVELLVRVTDDPEVPIFPVGSLTITS